MGDTGHIALDDLKAKLSVKRNGVVLNRKVVSLLAEFAVDIFFAGHDHNYEVRSSRNAIPSTLSMICGP